MSDRLSPSSHTVPTPPLSLTLLCDLEAGYRLSLPLHYPIQGRGLGASCGQALPGGLFRGRHVSLSHEQGARGRGGAEGGAWVYELEVCRLGVRATSKRVFFRSPRLPARRWASGTSLLCCVVLQGGRRGAAALRMCDSRAVLRFIFFLHLDTSTKPHDSYRITSCFSCSRSYVASRGLLHEGRAFSRAALHAKVRSVFLRSATCA